jgi:FkbM family methyltransferase
MLNLRLICNPKIGSLVDADGTQCILTKAGAVGHAIYGPYQRLEPGYYAVEICLRAAEEYAFDRDEICAQFDAAVQQGDVILGCQDIFLSQLQHGEIFVPLAFHNTVTQPFEFRLHVSGKIPLIIEERCRVIPLEGADADHAALLPATRFPDPHNASTPELLRTLLPSFRLLHENGAIINVADEGLIVELGSVSFHARQVDDIILVGELFLNHVYNFLADGEWCAIDIGMNIGLASLLLAAKPFVREVHAFEPFADTFERARANLSLNPEIADKISLYNVGLADKDEDKTVLIPNERPSGSFEIKGSPSGVPHRIFVRNAATALRPIIKAAKARGRDVIVKVDCEGSEFPIFAALDADGLIEHISAFMVEWHKIDWSKTQQDLMAPLLRRGFLVFDLSREGANGFFYAVRHRR